jgi:glucokinase
MLINDVEAIAYGIRELGTEALVCLQRGNAVDANRAVIAAGTGLGEAFLFWDGMIHRPAPCEGGHVEFGPRTELEAELWSWMRRQFEHVSYERLLSGSGLFKIYSFLLDTGRGTEPEGLKRRIDAGDPAAEISRAALERTSSVAADALEIFSAIYGAEAGNLALKTMASGGVYVAGGIAAKLHSKLTDGTFMAAFLGKGRFESMMRRVPVWVVTDEDAGMKGAARRAFTG